MFKLFKIRTELIEAQYSEILALKNLVRVLKNQVEIYEKLHKVDEAEIYRLRDEVEMESYRPPTRPEEV